MSLRGTTFQIPSGLRDVIQSGKCIVFIGSGLSAGSYAMWPDLVKELCKYCGIDVGVTADSTVDDLLGAAQSAKDHDKELYFKFLGKHFGNPVNTASLLYDTLLALPFECYLTLNFDPLLALKARMTKRACSLPVHAYPALDRKHARDRSIHYLHGIINENEAPARGPIVLSRNEFDEAYCENSNLLNFLVPTLENEHIVFVGCRLKEPAMGHVFDICKEHQKKRIEIALERGGELAPPPRRFIMLSEPVVKDANGKINIESGKIELEEQNAYYRARDIEPVWYLADGHDHSALRLAFDEIADLPNVEPIFDWRGGRDVS